MILVVNFGGQYAHLIARRVRELGVKSELVPPQISPDIIKKLKADAIILSGSPYSCYEKKAPKIKQEIYNLGIPILGICYGQQLIAYQLKGKVTSHEKKQFGKEKLDINSSPLFKGLKSPQTVWFSHGDQVDIVPTGFKIIASSKNAKVAAMENPSKKIFGIQFHAEVTHTPNGQIILSNFLFNVAGSKKDWSIKKVRENIVKEIKQKVGSKRILMAISGGVDSLVAAVLIKEAIGKNLKLLFIDTGLLRNYDTEDLKKAVRSTNLKNLKIVDASSRFLKALKGITDPEEKRKKIARIYFQILEEEAKKIKGVKFLGQGTIYPDRIESAQPTKHADKIKSHHNVTSPAGLKLELIEPLADLYKDEVRSIGKLLNIPQEFLQRHPFPGPGLAIRILGEVTEERLTILRQVDEIFIAELKKSGVIYNKEVSRSSTSLRSLSRKNEISNLKEVSLRSTSLRSSSRKKGTSDLKVGQALAALLPVKSVGVMGDSRTYSYIVSLRSVDTQDFMTADWSKIPYDILEKISTRIVNEVRGVNRVLYDITQKPPATIEYE